MFDHIDEDLMFSEYEIIFALAGLLILIFLSLKTSGIYRIISISLLVGYIIYLVDFYLKDLIKTVE